jgi:hypothetical protein
LLVGLHRAAVDRWIPGITKVELDGLTRRCTFADGHTQREEISDYSPATRSYRYTIDGGLPVTDNRGRFACCGAADAGRRPPSFALRWCASDHLSHSAVLMGLLRLGRGRR